MKNLFVKFLLDVLKNNPDVRQAVLGLLADVVVKLSPEHRYLLVFPEMSTDDAEHVSTTLRQTLDLQNSAIRVGVVYSDNVRLIEL